MKKKVKIKFDVWFKKNIADILWDKEFLSILNSIGSKKDGEKISFKGESFFVDVSCIRKSLVWGVPVQIDNCLETFIFKIPMPLKPLKKNISLNGGICYISHPQLDSKHAYRASGYYDICDNVFQVEKLRLVS